MPSASWNEKATLEVSVPHSYRRKHPLHEVVGMLIRGYDFPGYQILKDVACGGSYHLPLFKSSVKSFQDQYANVDLMILKSSTIKIIFEIEESDVKPSHIYGKFLASALSSYFIHESYEDVPIPFNDEALFIQILSTSGLKLEKTAKIEQWKSIERSIKNILPLSMSKIKDYKLFYGDVNDFGADGEIRKRTPGISKELSGLA